MRAMRRAKLREVFGSPPGMAQSKGSTSTSVAPPTPAAKAATVEQSSEGFVYGSSEQTNPHRVTFGTNNEYLLPLVAKMGYSADKFVPVAAIQTTSGGESLFARCGPDAVKSRKR